MAKTRLLSKSSLAPSSRSFWRVGRVNSGNIDQNNCPTNHAPVSRHGAAAAEMSGNKVTDQAVILFSFLPDNGLFMP